MHANKPRAALHLEDGSVFEGQSFGHTSNNSGEVVFNTSMVGYPETLTDPSYTGQILVFTYPLIGNYGIPINQTDSYQIAKIFESQKIHVRGMIVNEYSNNHNHWEGKLSLSNWLQKQKIPAITGIDTRMLTQKLRENGTMLGKIVINKEENTKINDPNLENLISKVSIDKPITYQAGHKKIVLVDCGMKNNILRNFLKRGITVHRVPWNYDPFKNNLKFNGIFFSNGPGDPAILTETHAIMKQALNKKIPTFGICLGTQIMAIAAGGKTYKLKYGHRSQNQPCFDAETKKCYITSQNHGYAIDSESLPKDWNIWLKNLNDDTCEGIKHKKDPFFSVQFHPESCPGPNDTEFLFDKFIKTL